MVRTVKLTILALAAYGGYSLWERYGPGLSAAAHGPLPLPPDRRVYRRAELTVTEAAVGSDDPLAQADAIIADSDARARTTRDMPGVEHRRSQDTVDPLG